jgi:hypothetical protein
MQIHPRTMILVGLVLVVLGFVVPFLMVLKIVEASFALSFLSYGASVVGLLLGLIGAAWYSLSSRR